MNAPRAILLCALAFVAAADARAASPDGDACTPTATTFATSVTFNGPPGVTIAGLGILVEYPTREVAAPTFSTAPGVANVTNDEGGRFVAEPIAVRGLPRPFMHATYKTCAGVTVRGAGDFKCTVKDASDDQGNVVDAKLVTCAVTAP